MPITVTRSDFRTLTHAAVAQPEAPCRPKKRGRKPRAIVAFPQPLAVTWVDPPTFPEAFALHLERHGDSCHHLHRAVIASGEPFDRKTFQDWKFGRKLPATLRSFQVLGRVERRYRLPAGYFREKLTAAAKAPRGHRLADISHSERRRMAWHLPDDLDQRPPAERAEIIDWVRTVIVSGATDYRRYQSEAIKHRYGLRFPPLDSVDRGAWNDAAQHHMVDGLRAPPRLIREVADLIRFKTATLTAIGSKRAGVWGDETVAQKVEHLGLLFGAMVADPASPIGDLGVPADRLTLGLLAMPSVWDWYLTWREAKRGFYTNWEANMLALGLALTRRETGWLRQRPAIAADIAVIDGLVTEDDVAHARADWDGLCDRAHDHCLRRAKDIQRMVRVHRDPFEPILAILETDRPLATYRRITAEIAGRIPDARRSPRAAAEVVRGLLMLRLGLHLGVRQKNLRQLLVCPRGATPRSDRQLETLKRGELRWNVREAKWEVHIPSNAFKNANSSFFGGQPFRLLLPDLDALYSHIDAYIAQHRPVLLAAANDPGTFFVKTVKRTSREAAYDSATFYEAWRLIIQRYGIYNPYTKRGAIAGLLPHGPHNVRDVLATHVLKTTGSFEQASYAIQDTPEMVAQHYGRFLPQDKAALAARILNEVWASD
ncbi:hypothetical protein [Sphingomonas faeni]|uniref:hypothetical protein n=1 Tax=Sphingomonas faeni TaxID=185950 RepID=UPI0020C79470|nr:hypothetical protein [Sphingomonas faeni]MCP8891517.1 hypothetical protein [Sphingomonas faeni]